MDKNELHRMIRSFLAEDIGAGDLTAEAIFRADQMGSAFLVAREEMTVAGVLEVAAQVFMVQNGSITLEGGLGDGVVAQPGDRLLRVCGPVVDLLKAERVALNLLQRLCGIATLTARYVEAVKLYPVRITDTRKTTPGLRSLEKYAVRVGGGYNHRFNLADGVLIKDNHLAACGSIERAVAVTREKVPHTIRIEVEVETMSQVEECLECGVDIIMLDNMDCATMIAAVKRIAGRALVEASGGITLDSVVSVAATGVDILSIGALTHSASSCDIGMDWR